jgi:hypothetical protein
MASDFQNFPWIAPWQAISAKGRQAYEYELKLELTPGHPLYGVKAAAIGRACNADDILFQLLDHPAELAVVHLTFTGRPEREPRWPSVTFYSDLDHWVARGLMPDIARFEIDPTNRRAA